MVFQVLPRKKKQLRKVFGHRRVTVGHGVERGIGTEGLQVQILHLNSSGGGWRNWRNWRMVAEPPKKTRDFQPPKKAIYLGFEWFWPIKTLKPYDLFWRCKLNPLDFRTPRILQLTNCLLGWSLDIPPSTYPKKNMSNIVKSNVTHETKSEMS